MMIFPSPTALIFLCFILVCLVHCYDFNGALELAHDLRLRTLKAAAHEADIAKRGSDIPFQRDVLLHYIDEPSQPGEDPLGAHVSLSSSRPTLVLEEIDHLLHEVHCEDDVLSLRVRSSAFPAVRDALESYPNVLVITSHQTCNDNGSRLPYLASLADSQYPSRMIELNIKPINWRNAYEMKVDYGVDHESYKVNQHNHLRRSSIHYHRDNSDAAVTTPAVSTPAVSTATTVAPSSQVVFPSPTSTPQPNQTVVEETIAKSFINAQILPISGSGGLNGFKVDGNSFPSDLALNCQNCTFTGNIQLTSGSFSTSNTSNSASHDSVGAAKEELSFIENGYIQVTADNLLAHVDLSTTWPLGFSEPLNVTLLDIPLTPFVIPGLATVGPEFKIQLLLAAKLSATANLTYGFEVTVPDNSTAIANIGQVNASSITGFGDTKFTALPFNANLNNIALNLSATLQLEVLVGISFLDGHDTAGAGVFVDLPTLALSVEPVKGTDQKCNPTTNQTIIQELGAEYDALFNIIPNVEINAGIIVQAKATIPGVSFAEQTAFTPLATTFPGPTACLAFPKSSGGLVSPTLPPANNAQATGGGSSSSGNHAHSQMVVNAAVMNAVIVGCLLFTGPLLMF